MNCVISESNTNKHIVNNALMKIPVNTKVITLNLMQNTINKLKISKSCFNDCAIIMLVYNAINNFDTNIHRVIIFYSSVKMIFNMKISLLSH